MVTHPSDAAAFTACSQFLPSSDEARRNVYCMFEGFDFAN